MSGRKSSASAATDRIRAEAAFRESEVQFRALVENLGVGIVYADSDDVCIQVNAEFCKITGFSSDELVGNTIHKLMLLEEDIPRVEEFTRRRLTGVSDQYELRLVKKNGELILTLVSATPFKNSGGEIVGTIATFIDISDRKKTLRALESQKRFFRQVIDTNPNLIFARDLNGRFTLVNKALADLYGKQPDELLGRHLADVEHDENRVQLILEEDSKVISDGIMFFDAEQELTHPLSGEKRSFQLIKKPLYFADETPSQVLGVMTDITERLRARAIMKALVEGTASVTGKHFFRSLVQLLAQLLTIKYAFVAKISESSARRVEILALWTDDKFSDPFEYEVSGTPSETVIGQELRVYPENMPQLFPADKDMLALGVQSYMGAPLFDSSGKAIGILALMHDQPLTDLAQNRSLLSIFAARAGAELERLRGEAERSELLRQLAQSQKMQAIGQLASGIAHDLNNSLSAVSGHLELIRLRQDLDPEIINSLDISLTGCERASQLIDRLLGFARQGKYTLKRIEVQSLLKETLEFMSRIIGRNINIRLEQPSRALYVEGDEAQLQQVFTNLLINAQQAMPAEGGSITIRLSSAHIVANKVENINGNPGSYALLSVTDTGCGIDPKIIDKIFEPFFTTKDKGQGSGLGLSMAYGVVQNHNGWITVESQPEKGSTFTVYLPLLELKSEIKGKIDRRVPKQGNRSVMIVDDEPFLVDLACKFFNMSGYHTQGFSDVQQALDWFEINSQDVDLVILDMKMPQMSGATCFEKLRILDPNCKVILLSGFTEDHSTQALLHKGALKFFQKPLRYPDLVEWVENYLAQPTASET